MGYVARPPGPALAPFVEHVWSFTLERPFAHERERILPTGTMQLLVNLAEDELRTYDEAGPRATIGGAGLCGAFARPFFIDTAEQRDICGVGFRPGGAHPFFRLPADAVVETHVPLDESDVWGRDGARVRERLAAAPTPAARLDLLERLLLERLARPLTADRAVVAAVGALDRGATVGSVVDRLGFLPRRFIRHFAERVGLTPKRFARVRRFQRVLASLRRGAAVDWAEVAAACGYFDQAHLIHDFRDFAGLRPTEYRPRGDGERNHVPA